MVEAKINPNSAEIITPDSKRRLEEMGIGGDQIRNFTTVVASYFGLYGNCREKTEALAIALDNRSIRVNFFVDSRGDPITPVFVGGQCRDLAIHLGYRLLKENILACCQQANPKIRLCYAYGHGPAHFTKTRHVFLILVEKSNQLSFPYDNISYPDVKRGVILDPSYLKICTFNEGLGYQIFPDGYQLFNPSAIIKSVDFVHLPIGEGNLFGKRLKKIPHNLPLSVFFLGLTEDKLFAVGLGFVLVNHQICPVLELVYHNGEDRALAMVNPDNPNQIIFNKTDPRLIIPETTSYEVMQILNAAQKRIAGLCPLPLFN
ncbi:MAG: hypothetical protein QHH09_03730 [Microgenomates group bacterium]|nr:hypothetical protein [Microgenomates group bacterium]